jgi:hypothetical protein
MLASVSAHIAGDNVHGAIKKHHDAAHEEQPAWVLLLTFAFARRGLRRAHLPPEQKATPISAYVSDSTGSWVVCSRTLRVREPHCRHLDGGCVDALPLGGVFWRGGRKCGWRARRRGA